MGSSPVRASTRASVARFVAPQDFSEASRILPWASISISSCLETPMVQPINGRRLQLAGVLEDLLNAGRCRWSSCLLRSHRGRQRYGARSRQQFRHPYGAQCLVPKSAGPGDEPAGKLGTTCSMCSAPSFPWGCGWGRRPLAVGAPGRRGPCPGPPPRAGGWCGCNQKWRSCREYRFMEQLPQRESVPQAGVFHTPPL